MTITLLLALAAPTAAVNDCTPPEWTQHLPAEMYRGHDLLQLLDAVYLANCQCDFPDSVVSRLTSGGGGASPPSLKDATQYCAGEIKVNSATANNEGTMTTIWGVSAKSSFYEGEAIQLTLVFVNGEWRAYLPVPVLDSPVF